MKPVDRPDWKNLRTHLSDLHRSALAAADPEAAVRRHLQYEGDVIRVGGHVHRLDPSSRVRLVAFGKAALGMARGAIGVIGERVSEGVVVHPEGAAASSDWPQRIRSMVGGHPLPTQGSLEAGACVARILQGLRPADVVLVLVSGGGSAMVDVLPPGLRLADLAELTTALLNSGGDITEINTVRRSLSVLKGGGLARMARPAATITLLLSDVLSDRPEAIASGPTVPSPTGPDEALRVLDRYDLRRRFETATRIIVSQARSVATLERDPRSFHAIVGSNRQAARALESEAARLGFRPMILTTHLQGEARETGRLIGGLAWSVRSHAIPFGPPACLVLGGETIVSVRGGGRGGRNQELALGAAMTLEGCDRAAVFSFATDGVDGCSGAAGAIVTGETLARARAAGLSVRRAFEESDTGTFFAQLGDQWVTNPSGTNVNDLTIVLVY